MVKKYVCIPRSSLVINVCNQGKTLCSPCIWHCTEIQINQPTRCNSFTSLLLDVYVWLNTFPAPLRPSSGAYNCTTSLWLYLWSVAVGELLVVVWQVMYVCYVGWFIWIVWWCTDLRTSNCTENLNRLLLWGICCYMYFEPVNAFCCSDTTGNKKFPWPCQ
jgi:hypothetical protein